MSESEMNAVVCEMCGGKLFLRADEDTYECESCETKYTKKWAENESQEANLLYKRATDFLYIDYIDEALDVLKEMTMKYPGDKRGWQKGHYAYMIII